MNQGVVECEGGKTANSSGGYGRGGGGAAGRIRVDTGSGTLPTEAGQFTPTVGYVGTYINPDVTWSSGATAVATINAGGIAVGMLPGTATITATAGLVSGNTTLSVQTGVSLTLSVSATRISENAGTAVVSATLSTATDKDVRVDLVFGGTATYPDDYSRSAAFILIPAGQVSSSITITGRADTLVEGDETVVVTAVGVANAVNSGPTSLTITLTDEPTAILQAANMGRYLPGQFDEVGYDAEVGYGAVGFFTFDITSLAGKPISNVHLHFTPIDITNTQFYPVMVNAWDVTTPPSDLLVTRTTYDPIIDTIATDLSSGTQYASVQVDTTSRLYDLALSPAAVDDLRAALSRGQTTFSIGLANPQFTAGYFDSIDGTLVVTETSPLTDPGFEQVSVGAGHFQYRPTGSAWTFAGSSGISGNNSGFTAGNPAAPEGAQVAFLQGKGSFSQAVSGWAAGSYVLTFDAAQRGNYQASQQDFSVLVDGMVVGTFTPSGTSYQSFTTASFTVTAGAHTITFQGLDRAGGDNTAFIDQVTVAQASMSSVADPGFEQVSVGAGQFQYRPTGSAWIFNGGAGLSGNNSGFTAGNPAAPEGAQVAFLQGKGSFSQAVSGWAAGSYVLTFDAAQRGNYQASHQDFSVLVDGVVIDTFTPSGTSYQGYTTAAFTVAAGAHTITFQGLDSAGGDNTAFIDQIVAQVSRSPIADVGFEQMSVGTGQFQYRPAGSAWTFSGGAGLSGNNSGFTAGNPAAPEGAQVAFLQGKGSFSQAVSGWAAGSYTLSFYAAQRGNYQASHQDFSVLIDGVLVGTFTPTGTAYRKYTTPFTVTAGSHTITFQGLDSAGGDNTAFVDSVVIS
jgi:hypothetical protein